MSGRADDSAMVMGSFADPISTLGGWWVPS